ncbi:hypothetical protein H8356DRAFT_1284857 [Neocallimastix lanati (nom. inval.)]|nr:hypothetical protein H8356DRAFT_1284857 [Neocallimastix sp. JGI-2020a]
MLSKSQTNDRKMEVEVENINNEPKSNNEEEPLNNSKNREETETLKEIDLSVIANPSINKAKRDSKKERISEIMDKKPEEEEMRKKVTAKLPSTQMEEKKNKCERLKNDKNKEEMRIENNNEENPNNKKEKHIILMENQAKYDLVTDLTSTTANITLAQLLDIKTPHNGKMEEMVLSTVSRKDIATTKCKINGEDGFAFLDTCASINIITSNFEDPHIL